MPEFCTVKKFVVILSLFILLKPILPVLEYMAFYEYIKNELCENKENVAMKCNGKCHLAKEMAKASDNPEKDKKNISAETNVVFYQEIFENYIQKIYFPAQESKITSLHNLSYSYLETASVFRPPIV